MIDTRNPELKIIVSNWELGTDRRETKKETRKEPYYKIPRYEFL